MAPGCINQVAEVVASFSSRRVLLVTDQGISGTPWLNLVMDLVEKAGIPIMAADEIEPNPRFTTIDKLAEKARSNKLDCVVGLGGGSVLDAAKAIAMLCKNPGSCLDYEGKNRFENGSVPFIAIPTTCGTGSEVTWVSVITHPGQQRKLSVKGDAMFPAAALVDPDMLKTLPAHLIASTGMDALTHAVEAYTVNCGNPVSDALAEKAIALLFRYLPALYRHVDNSEARFAVMRASTLAGMAFGNADVGGVHCLSETIGGIWDVPHGLANAMLLGPVMKYHEPVVQDRFAALTKLLDGPEVWDRSEQALSRMFLAKIEQLLDEVSIPGFSSLNIPQEEFERVALGAVANGSNPSNPQEMDVPAYMKILEQAT